MREFSTLTVTDYPWAFLFLPVKWKSPCKVVVKVKGGVAWIGILRLTCIHKYVYKRQLMRTYCMAQGTLLKALWWPKWEGIPKKDIPKMSHALLLLFSRQVVSDSSWPQGLQHARLPCPSPSPRGCPSSCPLNWWCHPAISSSPALGGRFFTNEPPGKP